MFSKATLLVAAILGCLTARSKSLDSVADINAFLRTGNGRTPFEVTVQVLVYYGADTFVAEDSSGHGCTMFGINGFKAGESPVIRAGDHLHLTGFVRAGSMTEPWVGIEKIDILGHGNVPPPINLTLAELDNPSNDYRSVCISGTVINILSDEIDAKNRFLILKDGAIVLPVAYESRQPMPTNVIDTVLTLTGRYKRAIRGQRKFSGPYLEIEKSSIIKILKPAPSDPFSTPPLENRLYLTPREVSALGLRTVRGRVVAAWNGNRLMVKESSGRIVNIELRDGADAPTYGQYGVFVGYPATDLFQINLTSARFKSASIPDISEDEPHALTADELLDSHWHIPNIGICHCRPLRMQGVLRNLPNARNGTQRMLLDCGQLALPIDVSACPKAVDGLVVGSVLEVTGRCLLEIDNWNAGNVFPQIQGAVLLTRTMADIRVLTHPPWWTPARLMIVIGIILTVLAGTAVWTVSLHRIAERRGRELMYETLAHERANLRVDERMRLAVELHDSIAQNMTGVSLQFDAIEQALTVNSKALPTIIAKAKRSLDACCRELRDCLWDLRNNSLEDADVGVAVRKALEPHLGTTQVEITLPLPRAKIADATFHAILSIIRELCVNAIRHGKAKTIAIRGERENDTIRISVTDDGCGFDPADRPGSEEGHFGLLGIEERLERIGGRMTINSAPGRGAHIEVVIES